MFKIVAAPQLPRLRVRRADLDVERVAAKAIEARQWRAETAHGGTVANKYGYPADTEGAVAIASPTGEVAVWHGRAAANKATTYGLVIASVVSAPRAAEDNRDLAVLFASIWDRRAKGSPLVHKIGWAAGRILHARAFGRAPSAKDQWLAQWGRPLRTARIDAGALAKLTGEQRDAVTALFLAGQMPEAQRLVRRLAQQVAQQGVTDAPA